MKAQPSVALLTQYFYPEVPGTAQISTDLALGLAESGFEVSVYTGQPAYWHSKRAPAREDYCGIRINRSYSGHLFRGRLTGRGHGTRLLNGATVALGVLLRLPKRTTPDVLLVDSTSPFLLVLAWLLRRLRGVPYIFVVHDVYPEIAILLEIVGPRSLSARIWRMAYRRVYGGAEKIVVLGPRMREVVKRSLAAGEERKCVVIPNWADGNVIVPRSSEENPLRRRLGLSDKLVVLYSGNMGPAHDMETVLGAAQRLRSDPDLRFLLIGDGGSRQRVESVVAEQELSNVILLPYQAPEDLPFSLTCGDISLVTMKRGMEGLSVPSKVYSSLAAGLAILAVSAPGSEIGDIAEEYRCGFRVAPGDVDGLVRAIKLLQGDPSLLKETKARSRACFDANYDRAMSIARYASVLRSVAGVTDDAPERVHV